jgi:serine-type D-Ala-D-Ala carboxypeptidase/endopeptidase
MFASSHNRRVKRPTTFLVAAMALLSFLLQVVESTAADAHHRASSLSQNAEKSFKPLVQREWATGIVLGIVDERGAHTFGFGRKGAAAPQPPDGDTVFEIGSVTKVLTGILLAEMVERGELRLEDPINQFLPNGIGKLEGANREIRLVDLATHTSGLPRMPTNFKPKNDDDPYADYTADLLHEFLKQHAGPSLAKTFGKFLGTKQLPKCEYSNLGVGLLGHLLERKAGRPYEELFCERVCVPLRMESTRLKLDDKLSARLITGHDFDGEPSKNWKFDCLAPCGGVRSTANDLLKLVAANLELHDSPLKAALAKARQKHFTVDADADVGLNWFLLKGDIVYHSGMTGGYTSFVAFCPSKKIGVVALADTTVGCGLFEKVGFALLKALTARETVEPPNIRATEAVKDEVLERYVGQYALVPFVQTFTVTREKDRLYAQLTGQDRCRIYPESDSKFFYKIVDAQIRFESDKDGKVTRLVLHQHGKDMPAARLANSTAK